MSSWFSWWGAETSPVGVELLNLGRLTQGQQVVTELAQEAQG